MKVSVLGAGLVGLPMAMDLAGNSRYQVSLFDRDQRRLDMALKQPRIACRQTDLDDEASLTSAIQEADIVVSAVPGHMGFRTLERIIRAGKDAVDIAFFPEDLFELDGLASDKGVTVVSDMGVAPGMSHLLCSYADHLLDQTDLIRIYVGGLPRVRTWPFEYRAGFSPADVIEEYMRPARFVRDGRLITLPALSEPELIDFMGIGTLEAFNSDGLRTLIRTIRCPDMVEKTLRYPGHIEKIQLLKACGFFSEEPVRVGDVNVRPIDMTSGLLFPMWDLKDEEDITIMQIIVEGIKDGQLHRYQWDLFDQYDPGLGVHSMARTTGYTATAVVGLLSKGMYTRKGVNPPEYLGKDPACKKYILDYLRDRKINYVERFEIR